MWRNITVAAILMLLTGVEAQHSVTLSSQSLCAVTGSTVKIPCTFTTPDHSSVTQREWYRVQSSEGEPQDLSTDPQYSGRVSVSTVTSDCELTVRNVSVSDSGVYNFRFKTQRSDWILASSGFNLTVTGLLFQDPVVCRFNVSDQCYLVLGEQLNLQIPPEDGFNLKITDKTSTTRTILKYRKAQDNSPSIPRWQFINENKTLILLSAERSDSGTYTLETYDAGGRRKGIYTLQVNTEDLKVTVSHGRNGNKKLICKATCTLSNNPTYIWYKNGQRVTNQYRNDEYLDVSSGDAGSYSCAVRGHEDLRSPAVFEGSEENTEIKLIMVGLGVFLALTLITGALWMWKRKSNSARGRSGTNESGQSVPTHGDDTYTALNSMNVSPDYDTLQNVESSASDTYANLNPAAMSSDYVTLMGVRRSTKELENDNS